jgi:hypothetical protein
MSALRTLKISYGIENAYRDVTTITLQRLTFLNGNLLQIMFPNSDGYRTYFYQDHLVNILKNIKVEYSGLSFTLPHEKIYELSLILNEEDISYIQSIKKYDGYHGSRDLSTIHSQMTFFFGKLSDELPEQQMACHFIREDDIVLELGSNIGRNTLTIASLLNDSRNLVTLECSSESCQQLSINRNINNYQFMIEPSALSKRKLIQKGWVTIPSDVLLPGYTPVSNITFKELENKYQKRFNVLVADCEGALYYILQDFPEMLNNMKKILMENDYNDINHKKKVDEILLAKGFKKAYSQGGGWGACEHFFFETWTKSL